MSSQSISAPQAGVTSQPGLQELVAAGNIFDEGARISDRFPGVADSSPRSGQYLLRNFQTSFQVAQNQITTFDPANHTNFQNWLVGSLSAIIVGAELTGFVDGAAGTGSIAAGFHNLATNPPALRNILHSCPYRASVPSTQNFPGQLSVVLPKDHPFGWEIKRPGANHHYFSGAGQPKLTICATAIGQGAHFTGTVVLQVLVKYPPNPWTSFDL
uniref:Coat protein n=1 Tax=Lentinula edodes deltaflexivirus 1 TaxID=2778979 RepID=A0A7S6Z339_9VIRU|nr:hypothetical protein [Lentinula edodes deltaflexivirus 1]